MNIFDFASIFLVALSLSADCFAVALSSAVATRRVQVSQILRMSLSFGIFQTAMQLAGWLAGKTVVGLISGFDHWIAFGLLAFVGGRMVWESFHEENEAKEGVDITTGFPLIALSVATSIDSLAVGLSYAFISIGIALPSILAGVIAFTVTATGFLLGKKVGELFGRRAETVGGLVLIGIGLRILVEHIGG
jgi:putative Mn2+ efflux pump MntP